MNTFYHTVINKNIELSKAFEVLSKNFTSKEWIELQEQFHHAIECKFPPVRCQINEEFAEEKNLIPEEVALRIKVAALLLTILAQGGSYSRKLYLNSLDFCTTTQVNSGSYV